MTKTILVLSRYGRNGASSRQRLMLYAPELERQGYSIVTEPFFSEEYLARLYANKSVDGLDIIRSYARRIAAALTARKYDVVWLEKELLPWLPNWFERLLLGRVPVVLDLDDGWHLRYQDGTSRVGRLMSNKIKNIARHADAVIVANDNLKHWCDEIGVANAIVIPTVIDCAKYPVLPEPDGPFTIGWIGTPVTAPYLRLVEETLRRLAQEGCKVRLIGLDGAAGCLGDVPVETVPWSEATEARAVSSCHVGIMPIGETSWEQYKSGYKIIQYMAAGRPAIASPVGANNRIIVDGVTGFFAKTSDDWFRALSKVHASSRMRQSLGAAARRRCESLYSLHSSSITLVQLMADLLDRQSAAHTLLGWSRPRGAMWAGSA